LDKKPPDKGQNLVVRYV